MQNQFHHQTRHFAICFHGSAHHWWQRILKKKFRHCFMVIEQPNGICLVDAMAPHLKLVMFPKHLSFLAIIKHYRKKNCIIWQKKFLPSRDINQHKKTSANLHRHIFTKWFLPYLPRFGIYSCVSVIKSFLNLRQPFVITPWQLYQSLEKIYAPKD
ncbi:MAG: hypothetical protein ACR2NY_03755 [Alphaproteobacteria bacterium]